jgi:hypothetical protein
VNLDDLLTLDEAAAWLRLNRRDLSEKSRGRRAVIPAIRVNRKVIRFHPRTILAKFAADAGVPLEVIAASYTNRKET